MFNSTLSFIFLILCCSQYLCDEKPPYSGVLPSIEPTDRFNEFDWNLSKAIGAKAAENVILSPISVKLVLAMLYEGARGNTSRQLEKALNIMPLMRSFTATKFSSILQSLEEEQTGYDINIGTKLFIDEVSKPKEEFQKKILNLYNATIERINFKRTGEAVSKINAWANAVTKGHIKNLVSDADTRESTVMLLLNAVYFKGLWEYPFPSNQTADNIFNIDATTSIKVPFMQAVNTLKFIESAELKASLLRMPYVGGKFAMYIVLPFEKTGLQDAISTLSPEKLRELIPNMVDMPVHVVLPKFQFDFAASLAPVLQQLGITDMFNSNADLSAIADGPKELVVSNVIQKAGIDVNEQGSTAYATTVVDLTSKFGDHNVEFKATHPFLFFIEHEPTDTVVFVGKVVDPTGIGKPQVQAAPPPNLPVNVGGELVSNKFGQSPTLDQTFRVQTFSYFDIELAQALNDQENVNWIASPSSVKTVLGLVLEGSDGTTLDQLIRLLRLPNNKTLAVQQLRTFYNELKKGSQNVAVKSASRILVEKDLGVKPKYKALISENYGVDIDNADFSSTSQLSDEINSWVKDLTQGLIPELINPGVLSANSSLVFLNAIYFKGDWKIQFEPSATHLACFYTSANECRKTEFMKATGIYRYGQIPSLGAKIIELEYSDPRYSMIILLPIEKDGLQRTIRNLPFNSLIPILENLSYFELGVIIPKFSIEYSVDLVPHLQKLGAPDLFNEKANFDDIISSNKRTMISGVIHKAKIDVNERGTIAAAATAVIAETLMSKQAIQFKADHPFMFFIRDSLTGFLFEGVYSNPTGAQGQVQTLQNFAAKESVTTRPTGGVQNLPYPRGTPLLSGVQSLAYPIVRNVIENRRY